MMLPAALAAWERVQCSVAARVSLSDALATPLVVAGADVSFSATDASVATVCVAACAYPSGALLHMVQRLVRIDVPYVPGFLAFREAPAIAHALAALAAEAPAAVPDVLLLDGNGLLHPRRAGVACQVGVQCGVPTVGVAKTFFCVDGLDKAAVVSEARRSLLQRGDWLRLVGSSGAEYGAAVRSTPEGVYPRGFDAAAAPAGVCVGDVRGVAGGDGAEPAGGDDGSGGDAGADVAVRGTGAANGPGAVAADGVCGPSAASGGAGAHGETAMAFPPGEAGRAAGSSSGSGRRRGMGDSPPAAATDAHSVGAASPIFVSVGHMVTLQRAVELTLRLCRYRVPEPIRLADKESRAAIAAWDSAAPAAREVPLELPAGPALDH
jgi:deoxyinosine 3'endonuclease (endonuclease V)